MIVKRLVSWLFIELEDSSRVIMVEGIISIAILLLVGFLVPNPAPFIMLGLLVLVVFNLAVAGGFRE